MGVHPQSGTDLPRAVFVGRRPELEELRAALALARGGRPQVVLVEGAAGIGKTALVERFATEAEDVAVLRASGDRSETDLAFGVAGAGVGAAGRGPRRGRRRPRPRRRPPAGVPRRGGGARRAV